MKEQADNIDRVTVDSFGEEWAHFDQSSLHDDEWKAMFDTYFGIFPWDQVSNKSEGFDMGCGSGRWAVGVAPNVGKLNCIDPSDVALNVSKRNLESYENISFHHASVDAVPLQPESQDFGYSLGVLHHIPDTKAALKSCIKLLKPGAPFLLYLYYRFDNRPLWFRSIWKMSEFLRAFVKRLPDGLKPAVTNLFAALIYWPLARFSLLLEKLGVNPKSIPLSYYRDRSFYTMRTDSRDRFGTPLEQRFTKTEITQMMEEAGLSQIRFSEEEPYWVAYGIKT